jgi:hypothetical protein
MGFLQTLQPDQTVTYRLRGYTATGSVPIDILAEEVGGGPAWPRVCGQTCNSTNYAWNIAVYALGGQAMMGLQDASTNGSYNYFYVKSSNWNQFTLQYGISDFGMLGGNSWPQILLQSPTEVHWVPSSTTAFKNENGIAFESGYTGPAYAVAKHKWPWNAQGVETDILINNTDVWCGTQDVIRSVFNADDAVQAALATNNPNTVICNAIPSGGGSISWEVHSPNVQVPLN